ncbi:hypothetical protein [Rhodopila sp.]|uniref:hypothetical protein n=1 Tax=Rhodopila sp. TaxID=2480087 RepID=UPI003D0E8943
MGALPTIADVDRWSHMVFIAKSGMDIAHWPNLHAWSSGLAELSGFAPPYDLIPPPYDLIPRPTT